MGYEFYEEYLASSANISLLSGVIFLSISKLNFLHKKLSIHDFT